KTSEKIRRDDYQVSSGTVGERRRRDTKIAEDDYQVSSGTVEERRRRDNIPAQPEGLGRGYGMI
ncbi:MAG TPA: hypothetical protein VF865_15485, partial [Acidobacteriaceae bacterium]